MKANLPRNHSSRRSQPRKRLPISTITCHGKPRRFRLCMARLMTHKTPRSQNMPVGNEVFNVY
jgi:hypothetical protein